MCRQHLFDGELYDILELVGGYYLESFVELWINGDYL